MQNTALLTFMNPIADISIKAESIPEMGESSIFSIFMELSTPDEGKVMIAINPTATVEADLNASTVRAVDSNFQAQVEDLTQDIVQVEAEPKQPILPALPILPVNPKLTRPTNTEHMADWQGGGLPKPLQEELMFYDLLATNITSSFLKTPTEAFSAMPPAKQVPPNAPSSAYSTALGHGMLTLPRLADAEITPENQTAKSEPLPAQTATSNGFRVPEKATPNMPPPLHTPPNEMPQARSLDAARTFKGAPKLAPSVDLIVTSEAVNQAQVNQPFRGEYIAPKPHEVRSALPGMPGLSSKRTDLMSTEMQVIATIGALSLPADSNVAIATNRPDAVLARHVATQVAQVAQSAPSTPVGLALNPEELGRIQLTFVTENGALSVAITAERPETLDLMRRHIDALAQELRSIGYREVNFGFSSDGKNADASTSEGFAHADEMPGESDDFKSEPLIDAPAETDPTIPLLTSSTQGVDLRL